ncbi:MarR family transcriptional regulator [Paenibacillus sp. P96]|uniref:MarR family transcriptional regulator n=1 Tax=Paenibacillus zeirhizosphaerae TaxID=2987519 RepID=A0ABT9FMC1_9BACL|nr:MarR family transcriptional regulator [Paenibacillus sp. P96]MDP4095850.1 MarR family transcriptional regulator [Paenibacillus sp. P96]
MGFFSEDERKVRMRKLSELFPQLELDSLRTLITFLHTSHEVYNAISGKLSGYGLSVGKLKIVMPLFVHACSLTPSELAHYSGVTRSTMTSMIDGLERDGIIKRASLDDRRMTAIHLTEKGREIMNATLPEYAVSISDMMRDFTAEDHELFIGLLQKLTSGLERFKDS